jgi:4-hydroxy-tetrahydrodipicolinate reductase
VTRPLRVSLYGAGQVSTNAAAILRTRRGFDVAGPFGRGERDAALRGGADVVVVATTSFLRDVAADVETAVEAGSNVITTAEEAAFPWANDPAAADRLDALARSRGVSVLGAGLNPGFAFDALVLTICGVCPEVRGLRVERMVDLGGFGAAVLARIGVGFTPEQFDEGCRAGTITGHIGFPQSMRVVAGALGVAIERIDREIEPVFADRRLETSSLAVEPGCSAGFRQRYVAHAEGREWFEALFTGHVAPAAAGLEPRDEIVVDATPPVHITTSPGMNPQSGSASVVANSIERVVAARPGWVTVADLPPAYPRESSPCQTT